MGKCLNCNITIIDDTNVCPLCRQILQEDNEKVIVGNTYPYVIASYEKVRLAGNILLFASIVAESILLGVTYFMEMDYTWAFVTGLILFCVNVLVRQTILGKSGYLFKILSSIVILIVVLNVIDRLTGNRGWSMELAWPAGGILLNLGIIALMIINHRNWQSYIMAQIFSILLGGVPIIFWALGKVNFPWLIFGSLGFSVFLFVGTLIIGDYKARTELHRRFHI